jgi:hypothetical protein
MTMEDDVHRLDQLDLEALRAEWRRRFGGPLPKVRSPELLRLCLAWRIQGAVIGGLDAAARRRLRAGGEGRAQHLDLGVQIRREWRGVTYQVDRVDGGYRWNDIVYPSLSAAARAITGVKRNGPKFFGLREEEAA